MNHSEAMAFAERWVQAWNDHDVEAVLAHFADDAVFTSPLATRIFPDSGGVVRGKDALRQYWTAGVQGNPALRFELLGVYVGVFAVVSVAAGRLVFGDHLPWTTWVGVAVILAGSAIIQLGGSK